MGAFHGTVFAHDHNPWRWAAIHGAFVAALAVANLISWRANESIRGATGRSRERFRRAFDDAPVAMALVAPDGRLLQANRELRERTGHGSAEGLHFWDLVPADDRAELRASWPPESDGPETERRYVRADGSIGWILWRHSLIRDARRPARSLHLPGRRHHGAQARRRAPRPPGPPRPADRAAQPRAVRPRAGRRARAPHARPAAGSRSCSATSTTSRSSTTRSAIAPATSCWSRSRSASAPCCARTTRSPASAATSS